MTIFSWWQFLVDENLTFSFQVRRIHRSAAKFKLRQHIQCRWRVDRVPITATIRVSSLWFLIELITWCTMWPPRSQRSLPKVWSLAASIWHQCTPLTAKGEVLGSIWHCTAFTNRWASRLSPNRATTGRPFCWRRQSVRSSAYVPRHYHFCSSPWASFAVWNTVKFGVKQQPGRPLRRARVRLRLWTWTTAIVPTGSMRIGSRILTTYPWCLCPSPHQCPVPSTRATVDHDLPSAQPVYHSLLCDKTVKYIFRFYNVTNSLPAETATSVCYSYVAVRFEVNSDIER